MSTHSVVAFEDKDQFVGVYVHFDGYPDNMIPVLEKLIARDGVEAVKLTILEGSAGWSFLDPDHENGYGKAYADGSDATFRDARTARRDAGASYLYLIDADGNVRLSP